MKLSGTAALYTQLKQLKAAIALTERAIAMHEEFENEGEVPAKKRASRGPRLSKKTKALPYDGVIGNLVASKPNGVEAE